MNPTAATVRLLTLVFFGIPTAIFDVRERRIPDGLTLCVFIAGGLTWASSLRDSWPEMAIAAFAGFFIPLIARIVTAGGLGWGDIKLGAGLSLLVGWPGILVALAAGAVLGLAAIIAGGPDDHEAGVPFGPFMIGGAVIAMMGEILPGAFLLWV